MLPRWKEDYSRGKDEIGKAALPKIKIEDLDRFGHFCGSKTFIFIQVCIRLYGLVFTFMLDSYKTDSSNGRILFNSLYSARVYQSYDW